MNTLVIGASSKPQKHSYQVIKYLKKNNYKVFALGLRQDRIEDIQIHTGFPEFQNIHTVLLYIGPLKQIKYYEYIISLNPKRIVFNPGTINPEFINLAKKNNIHVIVDCAINLISNKSYFSIKM